MAYGELRLHPAALAELIPIFKRQLTHCRLQENERLVAVSDSSFHPFYASACMGAALDLGAETFQVLLPHGRPWSEETLRAAFGPADVIVYSTGHTLHYSNAMREALDAGKRALMAVVPLHVLERRIADPDVIARTKEGAKYLDRAATVQIRSAAGTDLSMSVEGRPGVASYGVADEPGHLDFWGAGFFQIAVVEGTMEGKLVLDTGDLIFHFGRHVDRPVTISFREGRTTSFEGGVEARLIRMLLESTGDPNAFMAGHIACGTDRRARWTAEIAQFPVAGGGGADAEAYYGNVQIEIGSNNDVMFRGKNAAPVHLGLCCLNCTLTADGVTILRDGELVPETLRTPKIR
jgi:2,5-dihydroxypyridine 5,6-dioxygenase